MPSKTHQNEATNRNEPQGDYFFLDVFRDESAWESLLAAMPSERPPHDQKAKTPESSKNLPAYLAHLWKIPLLTAEEEWHGFRKLNFLKYRRAQVDAASESCAGCHEMLDESESLREQIHEVRNGLIESNLRLVVSLAKKYGSYGTENFDELVGVGNAALIRAVDLFDFRRGTRFSTYAYRAVQTSIFDRHRKEGRIQSRMTVGGSDLIESAIGDAAQGQLAEDDAAEARRQVIELMESLDERDRKIVMARFGIDQKRTGVAFHVIAKEIGLSTTRTVQLFHRSVDKMRVLLKQRETAAA